MSLVPFGIFCTQNNISVINLPLLNKNLCIVVCRTVFSSSPTLDLQVDEFDLSLYMDCVYFAPFDNYQEKNSVHTIRYEMKRKRVTKSIVQRAIGHRIRVQQLFLKFKFLCARKYKLCVRIFILYHFLFILELLLQFIIRFN